MFLKDVNKKMDELFSSTDTIDCTRINPHIRFDSDYMDFLFTLEDDKYARIELSPNFSEYIAWLTGNWKNATPIIESLAAPYNVQWDVEKGVLFIRFRRNEMTLAEAIMRLEQATLIVGSLNKIICI